MEEIEPPSAASKVRDALTGAAEAVRKTALSAAAKVSAAAEHRKEQMTVTTTRVLEDFIPALQSLVRSAMAKSSQTVEAALRDEVFLRKLFGAVHDVLPKPVCRFVSEAKFVEFCLRHRQKLLGKAS